MITKFLSKALKTDTGNLSIIFAGALLALSACAGVAIDIVGAGAEKAKTAAAADAGILAAVKAASEALIAGDSNWKNRGEAAGEQAFLKNLDGEARQHVGKLAVKIVQTGNTFTGKLAYEVNYQTSFMRMFNQNQMKVADEVTAGMGIPSYIDVHFLIDNSQSMGIGATNADQVTMEAESVGTTSGWAGGCALACHYSDHWTSVTLPIARANGVKLRIDVVKEAVQQFLADAKIKRSTSDQIRVSIHTFSNKITLVQAPTTNLDDAIAAANAIDLSNGDLDGGTNIAYSMQQHRAAIGDGGDGMASGRRQSFVILLSDGVEHGVRFVPSTTMPGRSAYEDDPNLVNNGEQYPSPGATRAIQTFNGAGCGSYKTGNHTVMAARVHYLRPFMERPLDDTPRLDFIEDDLTDDMEIAFRTCATRPEFAMEAAASSEIAPMLDDMLDVVFAPSLMRLTQ